MGYRESIMTDFEDKTIAYKGKSLYVIKQFDFEGKNYLYCVDKETVNKGDMNVFFLYRIDGDQFDYVKDDEKFNILVDVVAGFGIADIIKKNTAQ